MTTVIWVTTYQVEEGWWIIEGPAFRTKDEVIAGARKLTCEAVLEMSDNDELIDDYEIPREILEGTDVPGRLIKDGYYPQIETFADSYRVGGLYSWEAVCLEDLSYSPSKTNPTDLSDDGI